MWHNAKENVELRSEKFNWANHLQGTLCKFADKRYLCFSSFCILQAEINGITNALPRVLFVI